jgi:hypothetical protein
VKLYVLHENPAWFGPFADEFAAVGLAFEEWPLGEGVLDLDRPAPAGVFWSRMSASAHTRGHPHAADHARALLDWLAAHGRRVVNGRSALELELSKVAQLTALRAAGFDVPLTVAVAGADGMEGLLHAAAGLPRPFLSKPNRGGKGLDVRLFGSLDDYAAHLASADHVPPVDGITLLQEYVAPATPSITRVEVVGGEFLYAIAADTSRGGFELCPADACATGPGEVEAESLFTLRDGFADPIVDGYLEFAARHGIEVAGFEFLETTDGRRVTYDINTTTNYNPQVEALAPRSGRRAVADFLGRLLVAEEER